MFYSPGCCDNQILWSVVLFVVLPDGIASHRTDCFFVAADWATKLVVAEHGLRESLVRDILRVIVVHGEFFENHRAFVFKFGCIDERRGEHVCNDVDGKRQSLVLNAGVIAGVLFAG